MINTSRPVICDFALTWVELLLASYDLRNQEMTSRKGLAGCSRMILAREGSRDAISETACVFALKTTPRGRWPRGRENLWRITRDQMDRRGLKSPKGNDTLVVGLYCTCFTPAIGLACCYAARFSAKSRLVVQGREDSAYLLESAKVGSESYHY